MKTKPLVKIGVSLIFIVVLTIKIDLHALMGGLAATKLGYYAISLLFLFLNTIILAAKYKTVMAPAGIHQPLRQLVKINFMCRFYSMFLSSAVGQSVIRWYYTTKNSENRGRFVATFLYERASFVFVLLAFLLVSGIFLTSANLIALRRQTFFFLIVLFAMLIFYYTYLLQPQIHLFVNRRIASLAHQFRESISTRINYFIESVAIYCGSPRTLVSALGLASLWQFAFLMRVYFLTVSIDVSITPIQLTWMASFVLLLQSIPLTLNGIGLREGAYAYLFSLENLPVEAGVSLGILLFSQILIVSIIGGVLSTFYDTHKAGNRLTSKTKILL